MAEVILGEELASPVAFVRIDKGSWLAVDKIITVFFCGGGLHFEFGDPAGPLVVWKDSEYFSDACALLGLGLVEGGELARKIG